MYQRHPQNTTSIDELPDIDEIEGPRPYNPVIRDHLKESNYPDYEILPVGEADKFQKYIRQGHVPSMESGMNNMFPDESVPHMKQSVNQMYEEQDFFTEQEQPKINPKYNTIELPPNSPSCIDVSNHFMMCPVCSRLYHNDKTVYIISIVVLAFVCILLLKKVLDV